MKGLAVMTLDTPPWKKKKLIEIFELLMLERDDVNRLIANSQLTASWQIVLERMNSRICDLMTRINEIL